MFELVDSNNENAIIKVIGVGGGGSNAVEHMLSANIEGVDFICANTDAQALRQSSVRTTVQLGTTITKGLGAGANPEIGQRFLVMTGLKMSTKRGLIVQQQRLLYITFKDVLI